MWDIIIDIDYLEAVMSKIKICILFKFISRVGKQDWKLYIMEKLIKEMLELATFHI